MTTVRELHHQAMTYSQDAAVLRYRGGDHAAALDLNMQALEFEEQAAALVANEPASEPTRGILYLSAASIAMCAGEYDRSLTLIAEGLAGSPSGRIRSDLLEVRDQVEALKAPPSP